MSRPPITTTELRDILTGLIEAGHGDSRIVVSWSGDVEDDHDLGDNIYTGDGIVRLTPLPFTIPADASVLVDGNATEHLLKLVSASATLPE